MRPKGRADFVRPHFCFIYNVCTTLLQSSNFNLKTTVAEHATQSILALLCCHHFLSMEEVYLTKILTCSFLGRLIAAIAETTAEIAPNPEAILLPKTSRGKRTPVRCRKV